MKTVPKLNYLAAASILKKITWGFMPLVIVLLLPQSSGEVLLTPLTFLQVVQQQLSLALSFILLCISFLLFTLP